MKSFAECLTEARQAAGMTQAELADALHVARNTISGWEHGRSTPGIEVIRQINSILNCDLLKDAAFDQLPENAEGSVHTEPSDTADSGETAETAVPSPAASETTQTVRKLALWKILVPIVLLAAVVTATILLTRGPGSGKGEYRDPQGVVYRPEDYAAVKPRQEGKPYISIARRLDNNESLQMYTFIFTEDQGFPVKVQKLDYIYFKDDYSIMAATMTAKQLADQGEPVDLPPHGTFDFVGGFPANNRFVGVGIELYVQDESGEVLSFTSYQELTKN